MKLLPSIFTAVLALFIVGCGEIEKYQERQKPELPISATFAIERDDNLLEDDRYFIKLSIYHEAPQSVNGRFIVKAFGDVFGNGGQESSDTYGDNYDETDVMTIAPGSGNATRVHYYINDPNIVGNDLDPADIRKYADMRITVDFIPSSTDSPYRQTQAIFPIVAGK